VTQVMWPDATTPDWGVLPSAAGPPLIAWTSVADPTLRHSIVSILRHTGYAVAGTEDPQRLIDGLSHARARGTLQPTLVVIGATLSSVFEVAQRLHEIDAAIPIIAVVDDMVDRDPSDDELLVVRPYELGLIHVAAQAVAAATTRS